MLEYFYSGGPSAHQQEEVLPENFPRKNWLPLVPADEIC